MQPWEETQHCINQSFLKNDPEIVKKNIRESHYKEEA